MGDTSASLQVLIQIQAELAQLTASISGMNSLGASAATANGAFAGVQSSAAAAAQSIGSAGAAAHSFGEQLKGGFAIELANRFTESVIGIGEAFKEVIAEGVRYRAEIETTMIGLAGTLRSVEPQQFLSFDAARGTATAAMDAIREKANALGLDFHSLAEAYSANFRALVEGGVTDMEKQITLVSTILQAEKAKNITGVQALKDSIDLLNGRASQIVFAKEIGLTSEALKEATTQGNLYGVVMSKLTGYQEAAKATADSFSGQLQTLRNKFEQVEGDLAKPVFDVLKAGFATLNADLSSGAVVRGLRSISEEAAAVLRVGVGVTHWAIENAGALTSVAQAAGEMALAFGAVRLGGFVVQMGAAALAARGLSISLASVNQWTLVAAAAIAGWNLGSYIAQYEVAGQTVTEWGTLTVSTISSVVSRIKGFMLNLAEEVKAGILKTLNDGLNQLRYFAIGAASLLSDVTGGRMSIDTSGWSKAIDASEQENVKIDADKAKAEASIGQQVKENLAYYRGINDLVKQDVNNRHAAAAAEAQAIAPAKAITFAKVEGAEADEKSAKGKRDGAAADREALNVAKEQAALQRQIQQDKLKSIQGFGSRVQENPFLDEESKAKLMLSVYAQERDQLVQIMKLDAQRIALEKNSTNPGMAAQLRTDTKGLAETAQQLLKVNQQMRAMSFSGTMQKSLTAWVSQFGTMAQSAASIVTNVLGHAVEGLSNAISGLVLGTMTWKQAFSQAASAIVQDIIRIVVQQTVGRAVMAAVNMAFGSEEASVSSSLAESTAASWSEAAILASIASYGGAAAAGLSAVLISVGAGQGALAGMSAGSSAAGYAAGGYTGDGATHEVAGVVHRGEYIFDARTVDRGGGPAAFDHLRAHINSPRLEHATAGIGPTAGGGGGRGGMSPSGRKIHVHNNVAIVRDDHELRQWSESVQGERHIISAVKKHRRSMGIRT